MRRNKNLPIFIFCILLAAGIYLWSYPLNYGTVTANGNVGGFAVTSDDGTKISCPEAVCQLKLKSGIRVINFTKDGYVSDSKAVQLKRFGKADLVFSLAKIPDLSVSEFIPAEKVKNPEKPIPSDIDILSVFSAKWNLAETMLAYIDTSDDRLKILKDGNRSDIIVSLKNLTKNFEILWSPDEKFLFGNDGKDIYFIDIEKAARKKDVLDFNPHNFIWADDKKLIVNDDSGNLYSIDILSQKVEPFSAKFDLGNSVFSPTGDMISFEYDSEKKESSVKSLNIGSGEIKTVLTQKDFIPDKISVDEKKNVYIHNSINSKWYLLEY